MSNTHHAKPGSPLRQQRFASSPELESGLLGNLVARRCQTLESAEDRQLIWMLQHHSWQKGGLQKFAAEPLRNCGHRIGTEAMRRFGVKVGGNYNSEQVRTIRRELRGDVEQFILRGKIEWGVSLEKWAERESFRQAISFSNREIDLENARRQAAQHPNSYPVLAFTEVCMRAAQEHAEEDLTRLCLDPAFELNRIWYFHELRECLSEHQEKPTDFAHTSISRAIWN